MGRWASGYFHPCSIVSKFDDAVSAICSMCDVENYLFHTFYHCKPVNKFWAEALAWYLRITNKAYDLYLEGIFLGFCDKKEYFSLYIVILYGKYYIHKCRLLKKVPIFKVFLNYCRKNLEIKKNVYSEKGKSNVFREHLSIMCISLLCNFNMKF